MTVPAAIRARSVKRKSARLAVAAFVAAER
jgi:hypothetical protein